MAAQFPDTNPYLTGNYGPVRMEADAPDLEIEGEVPEGLAGVLYRNGPNPHYAPWSEHHHWFLGDGMIHALFVENGRVRYRNRWVKTEKFKAEARFGEAVMPTDFDDILKADPRSEGIPLNVANTNVVYHAGKLLALEEGSPPVELDADTLDTIGPWTFGGDYGGPFTAHPKMDPDSGEMVFFGYMAGGPGSPQIAYNVADASGGLTRSEMIEAPFCSMVHDFLVTENFVGLPVLPATASIERMLGQKPFFAWEPDKGNHIGIFDRSEGAGAIRWFTGNPSYVYHPLNAYEEDGKLIADVMQYERIPLFADPDGTNTSGIDSAEGRLTRWTFDLGGNSDTYSEEALDDFNGEFPRFDERFAGKKHSVGYFAVRRRATETGGPFDTLLARNFKTGSCDEWTPGAGEWVQEPVFVPRSADAPEGDGWLLSLTYKAADNLSDLVILDAQNLAAGPVARAKLPTRVPYGFHGNWRSLA